MKKEEVRLVKKEKIRLEKERRRIEEILKRERYNGRQRKSPPASTLLNKIKSGQVPSVTWTEVVKVAGFQLSLELKDGMCAHEEGLAVLMSMRALPLHGDNCKAIKWNRCTGHEHRACVRDMNRLCVSSRRFSTHRRSALCRSFGYKPQTERSQRTRQRCIISSTSTAVVGTSQMQHGNVCEIHQSKQWHIVRFTLVCMSTNI